MIAALANAFVPIFVGLLLGYLAGLWKFVVTQVASGSLIATYVAGLFTMAGWMILLDHLH
jgi:uncharacterized protein YjeT (DUF2065 family)